MGGDTASRSLLQRLRHPAAHIEFQFLLDAVKGIAINPLTIAKPPTRAGAAMRLNLMLFPASRLAEVIS